MGVAYFYNLLWQQVLGHANKIHCFSGAENVLLNVTKSI